MRRARAAGTLAALVLVSTAPAVARADEPRMGEAIRQRILRHAPLPPPPPDETNAVADDPRAAALGRLLFQEPRLSRDGRVSCITCHQPARGFADGRPLPEAMPPAAGVKAPSLPARNVPSLWNVAYNRWLFWDGRADALWSQALKPIESPVEMGGDRRKALRVIADDPVLRAAWTAVFGAMPALDPEPDPATLARAFANLGKALGAFERGIVSRRAPFDVYAEGLRDEDPAKIAALSAAAQRGAALFVGRANCAACHAGPLFTDGEFHDVGLPLGPGGPDPGRPQGVVALLADEFAAGGPHSDDRDGPRARRTRHLDPRPEAQGQMKTPGLRNVALTAPYMHQGQLATLGDVLEWYSTLAGRRGLPMDQERILTPLRLDEREKADLVAFLESLTDTTSNPFNVPVP